MANQYFPNIPNDIDNPAIQLFGNRLFRDQTVSELLVEFFLVAFSTKKIGNRSEFITSLPDLEILNGWESEKLYYAPKARLNLKLFSFLGVSRLETRHFTHRNHHKELIDKLKNNIKVTSGSNPDEVIHTIEDLFMGFQGAGNGRTWCSQSFLPISKNLLAGESIWKEKKAKNLKGKDWISLFENGSSYFDRSQHVFLARGGELLYLQICNGLKQPTEKIKKWSMDYELELSDQEQDPTWLHNELGIALTHFIKQAPEALNDLAEFIDGYIDPETSAMTDRVNDDQRFVSAGFCNSESWQEGYLFALDLLKLLKSNMGLVDKIYLLELACALQVLRTITMQSARSNAKMAASFPGYRLVISAQSESDSFVKRLSQESVKGIESLIFNAIRNEDIVTLPHDMIKRQNALKQADQDYGGKLYLSLAKRIGLIVPKRGSGARFVINDSIVRLLVITTVPLGKRLTIETFLELLEHRYGLVFGVEGYTRASQWLNNKRSYFSFNSRAWIEDMLEAAGFLIHLSDSFALVHNPADSLTK